MGAIFIPWSPDTGMAATSGNKRGNHVKDFTLSLSSRRKTWDIFQTCHSHQDAVMSLTCHRCLYVWLISLEAVLLKHLGSFSFDLLQLYQIASCDTSPLRIAVALMYADLGCKSCVCPLITSINDSEDVHWPFLTYPDHESGCCTPYMSPVVFVLLHKQNLLTLEQPLKHPLVHRAMVWMCHE